MTTIPTASFLGPFLIAATFDFFLMGSLSTQTWTYYRRFGSKRSHDFILVTSLLLVNIVSTCLSLETVYRLLVHGFGNLAALSQSPFSWSIQTAFTPVVAVITQAFFARRIYYLTGGELLVPVLIGVLSLVEIGFSILLTVNIFSIDRQYAHFDEFSWIVNLTLSLAPLIDVLITGSLIYYLKRIKTEHVKTTNIIDRILLTTVETNGLTALIAISILVLFRYKDDIGLWFVVPGTVLQKFYMNSVLLSLNSRVADPQSTQTPTDIRSNFKVGSLPLHNSVQVQFTTKEEIEVDTFDTQDYVRSKTPSKSHQVPFIEMKKLSVLPGLQYPDVV